MTNLAFNFDGPPPIPDEIARRVSDARSSGRLSDCEEDVLALLVDMQSGPRLGIEKALQISAMQEIWTRNNMRVWGDRAVKEATKRLLEVFGVPVGSSRKPGSAGYYVIECDAQVESTVRVWMAEISSLARRCKALSPKSGFVRGLLGQLRADLGGEL